MRVIVRWDFIDTEGFEGLSYDDALAKSNLPAIVEVPGGIDIDLVSDWLSDEYGFCHYGWHTIKGD